MANYLKAVVEGTKKLLQAVPEVVSNPQDKAAAKKLKEAAAEVAEATHQLIGDTGKMIAVAALFTSAKQAAAATVGLVTSSKLSQPKIADEESKKALLEASKAASEAIQKFVGVLKNVTNTDGAPRRKTLMRQRGISIANQSEAIREDIMQGAEQFAPSAYKLVSTAKATTGTR